MALNCGTEKYVVGESNNKISHSDEKEQPTMTHSDTEASHRQIVEEKKKKKSPAQKNTASDSIYRRLKRRPNEPMGSEVGVAVTLIGGSNWEGAGGDFLGSWLRSFP